MKLFLFQSNLLQSKFARYNLAGMHWSFSRYRIRETVITTNSPYTHTHVVENLLGLSVVFQEEFQDWSIILTENSRCVSWYGCVYIESSVNSIHSSVYVCSAGILFAPFHLSYYYINTAALRNFVGKTWCAAHQKRIWRKTKEVIVASVNKTNVSIAHVDGGW